MDHFVRDASEYHRETQYIPTYIRDSATYLQKMTGTPFEDCEAFVKKTISEGGARPMQRPMATVLLRDRTGDRKLHRIPFDKFIGDAIEANEVIAPNLTGYISADIKESLPAQYITQNLKLRSAAKKEMLAASMAGNDQLESIKNAEQTTYKYKNNSLSGAHRSEHTPLYNKSSHSTLTSFCRCGVSYGNANNEKFLMGNRHYWCPDVVKTNLIAIINSTDLPAFEATLTKFGIRPPTVEETISCIDRSAHLYWRNIEEDKKIRQLVEALTPTERAAFVYSGDLYHLAKCNETFVREMFESFIAVPHEGLADPDPWVKAMDDDLKAYVSLLCAHHLDGDTIRDMRDGKFEKIDGVEVLVKPANPHGYAMLAATAKQVSEVLDHYGEFIRRFWVVDTVPASISYFPASLRRTAITSDTDSTVFTVQHWVQWFTGKMMFDERSNAVAYTAVYLTSQTIRHVLAKLSINLGVRRKDIFKLSMKNEYFFPVFVLTSRAKHYFAYMSAREGNVYKKMKMEVKGVALRNSKVPVYFNEKSRAMMKHILDTVYSGKKLSIIDLLDSVAQEEQAIIDNVVTGRYNHLTKEHVRPAESYKNPASSNYVHYGMWEEVFAPKYGHIEAPPYRTVKISLNMDSPTKVKEWLSRMEDKELKERFVRWMESIKKDTVTMLLMPETILALKGVPQEAIIGVDTRQLVITTMEAFYVVLESLGIYIKNDNNTRLISDGTYVLPKAA